MTRSDRNVWMIKRVLFTTVPLLLLLIFYARWLFSDTPAEPLSILLSALVTFLYALLGIRFIPQWMDAWSTSPLQPIRPMEGKRSARPDKLHPFLHIALWLIAYRLLLFALAYGVVLFTEGYSGGIFDTLSIWNRIGTDSRHYLHIAEFGYTAVGDDRLLIVFFPFYPLLVRLFSYVFQNFFVSGLFVSNVCCVFAGYMLYEVALLDADKATALRTVKFFCLLPASLLFSAPLSDSLFLLLSLCCIYFLRKEKYFLCGLMGMLAAFTRAPGVLLFVPVCFELVCLVVREYRENRNNARWAIAVIGRVSAMLLIPLGVFLYMLVNDVVTGSPTTFLVYQREHWHNRMGWFFASIATQGDGLLDALSENRQMAFGLWLPGIVYTLGSLGIVAAAHKKLRASNVAYFIAYFTALMGATWLLSGPRYLTACYPLAIALGVITKKRWENALATGLCAVGLLYYLVAFVNQWYVY